MSRMKAVLLGLMAVMALSSVVSATAQAEIQGPWWQYSQNGKQFKYTQNKEQAIKSENQGNFTLRGKVLGITVSLKCETVSNIGFIWNGLHQGQDEAVVAFTKCFTIQPCAGTAITVTEAKVFSELQWKFAGNQSELTEQPVKQQKIYNVFAPTEPPEQKTLENGEKVARAIFVEVSFPASCGLGTAPFKVEAAGSLAKFEDQNLEKHVVVWGTAAEVNPQNRDAKVSTLHWQFPNVTQLHHQGVQTKAKLLFANNPAELEGTIHIKRINEEEFGAFNE